MSQLRLSRKAEQDLDDIWTYLGIELDRPQAAVHVLERLFDAFSLLSQRPSVGERCPHLRPALRRFVVGPYVIYYVPLSNGAEIERVIHGARDVDALF